MPVETLKPREEYRVRYGNYETSVSMGQSAAGSSSLNATISLKRKEGEPEQHAWLNGSILAQGKKTTLGNIFPSRDTPKTAGLRAIIILLKASEAALKKHGVKKIVVNTHADFAKFLKRQGYRQHGTRGGLFEMEKNLSSKN